MNTEQLALLLVQADTISYPRCAQAFVIKSFMQINGATWTIETYNGQLYTVELRDGSAFFIGTDTSAVLGKGPEAVAEAMVRLN